MSEFEDYKKKVNEIVEKGFKDVGESLGGIIGNVNAQQEEIEKINKGFEELNTFTKDLQKRVESIEERLQSLSIPSESETNKLLETLTSAYQDYDFLLAPHSDAFHFLSNVDVMLEGTEPKSDVEITKYIKETYGLRGIHFVNAAIKGISSSSRITLVRSLKRIKKILSSNEFDNEGVDDIEDD